MRILMLATRLGSEDGFFVSRFERDHFYDIADTLARAFIREDSAIELATTLIQK